MRGKQPQYTSNLLDNVMGQIEMYDLNMLSLNGGLIEFFQDF